MRPITTTYGTEIYLKGINFREDKFSRGLILARIYFRESQFSYFAGTYFRELLIFEYFAMINFRGFQIFENFEYIYLAIRNTNSLL